MSELDTLVREAEQGLSRVTALAELDALRVRYLGRKGELTLLLKQLGGLPPPPPPAPRRPTNPPKQPRPPPP
ncbi:MAG: phenylalanine--tRNA ligase subunit alpha, partial [Chromatiales bacterium]|nr:phenylalanine--tRNA ligase subunit alpha [Chromatiales bacterium]